MMNVESYDYQAEELKATEQTEKTIDDLANEPIDKQTEGFFKNVGGFFNTLQHEKKIFQPSQEKTGENPDLDSRVARLEKKMQIMENMQIGLDTSIAANPQLSALLNRGSVNYNPEAMGKEVFVSEESSLENAYA